MTKTIRLDDQLATRLAESLQKENEQDKQKIILLSKAIEERYSLIKELKVENGVDNKNQMTLLDVEPKLKDDGFNRKGTLISKGLFILNKEKKFLVVGNFADIEVKYDPEKRSQLRRMRTTAFSAVLRQECIKKKPRIKRYFDEELSQYKHGLPEWFDGDMPKDEYKK